MNQSTGRARRVLTGVIAPDAPEAWMNQLAPADAPAPQVAAPRWALTLLHEGRPDEELRTNTDATLAATLRAVADRIDPAPAQAPARRGRRRWWPRRG